MAKKPKISAAKYKQWREINGVKAASANEMAKAKAWREMKMSAKWRKLKMMVKMARMAASA